MTQFNAPHLLLVDDDQDLLDLLSSHFRGKDYRVTPCRSASEAREFLRSSPTIEIDLVLSDLRLPELSGLDFIDEIKKLRPDVPIVIMTAYQSVESAVDAIRRGAFDYVVKPLDTEALELSINRAFRVRRIQRENEELRRALRPKDGFAGVIGRSEAMKQIFGFVEKVAPSFATVLITGESGTGKEIVAKLLHDLSPRKDKPFVAINCAALPENLLESELFGHARGAFTGATDRKKGLFEEAEGGTLFLDEIGELPQTLQAKLLRALQERKIRRVGENRDIDIDVRILAATHRRLAEEVQERRFREDLYFRLNVIPLEIPPLRERRDDIIPLCRHFLDRLSLRYGAKRGKELSRTAVEFVLDHPWPGNVRELENAMERAFVLSRSSDTINVEDFANLSMDSTPLRAVPTVAPGPLTGLFDRDTLPSLAEVEDRYIELVLKRTSGVKEKAARILGIDRKTLYRRLAQERADSAGLAESGA